MSENSGNITVTVKIDVKNLENIARRLDLLPAFRDGVQAAGQYLKGIMQEYPPMTASNTPGRFDKRGYPMGYYERGKGSWSPIVRQREVVGWKVRKTSETMGRRWALRAVDNRLGCIVGNNASYARYVHDKTKQAKIHDRHGWQTIQDVADRESKKVAEIITDFMIAKLREQNPGITALPT